MDDRRPAIFPGLGFDRDRGEIENTHHSAAKEPFVAVIGRLLGYGENPHLYIEGFDDLVDPAERIDGNRVGGVAVDQRIAVETGDHPDSVLLKAAVVHQCFSDSSAPENDAVLAVTFAQKLRQRGKQFGERVAAPLLAVDPQLGKIFPNRRSGNPGGIGEVMSEHAFKTDRLQSVERPEISSYTHQLVAVH